jgi:type I restriction enzyme S subunit
MSNQPSSVEIFKCSDYCIKVADGTHDSPKESTTGKLLVTSKNIKNSRLSLESAYLISIDDFNEINKRSKVDKWDLLLTMIGTVGEVCIVKDDEPDFAIKNVGLLKTGDEYKSKWLYYYLKSNQGKQALNERKKGTTQEYLALGEIRNLPIPTFKDRSITYKSVSILDALEKKIDLLNATNKTLESIAQAIFKSWFVDFDPVHAKQQGKECAGIDKATANLFPDSFEESELGLLPKGWKVGIVDHLGEVICGKTPPTSDKENFDGNIPFITIPDMHNNIAITSTNRYLSTKGANSQNKKYLRKGSVCISCIATPGLVSKVTVDSQSNQQINSVIPDVKWGDDFVLFLLRRIGEAVKVAGSGGSIFHNLNTSNFRQIKVILPNENISNAFNQIASICMEKIICNQHQIKTLNDLRDTLLPRLISGKLDLSNIEEQLEGVD